MRRVQCLTTRRSDEVVGARPPAARCPPQKGTGLCAARHRECPRGSPRRTPPTKMMVLLLPLLLLLLLLVLLLPSPAPVAAMAAVARVLGASRTYV